MFHLPTRIALVAGLGLLAASPVRAQTIAHASHAEGAVSRLHRQAPGVLRVGVTLAAGDEVHTAMGRAELTLVDGTQIEIDEHSRVALHATDRIAVPNGRIFVNNLSSGTFYAHTGGGRVHVPPQGAVEIMTTAAQRDLLVRVLDGDARVESPWGIEPVAATQTAFVSGPTGHPFVTPWLAPGADAFYQYASTRFDFLSPPATFLPYAHPVYRQQQYLRLLRKTAPPHRPKVNPLDREVAPETHTREVGPAEPVRTGTRGEVTRRKAERSTPSTGDRREPPPTATTLPTAPTPAPARRQAAPAKPAPAAKGAGAGAAVRKP